MGWVCGGGHASKQKHIQAVAVAHSGQDHSVQVGYGRGTGRQAGAHRDPHPSLCHRVFIPGDDLGI